MLQRKEKPIFIVVDACVIGTRKTQHEQNILFHEGIIFTFQWPTIIVYVFFTWEVHTTLKCEKQFSFLLRHARVRSK